uniref:DNA-binding protein HEXBP-like n=1 Tax=Diabrotica virgifera virgifera TaxID=50390 RepID=A0A6P7GP05_DIAVI
MDRAEVIVATGSKWHDRANPAGEVQGERQRSLRRVPYTPCRRCGQVGHWTRECTIYLGNQKSGESRWKPEERPRLGKKASNEECFQCGRPAHFINTCPQTICDNCGYGGHVWRQCQNTGTSARRGPFSRRQRPWESDKSDRGVEDYASLAGRRAESRSVSPN